MGELFINKIIGAVLATFLTVFALTEVSHMLIHPHELEEPAYPIEVPEGGATGGEPEIVDIGLMLREASVESGANQADTLCSNCHTFNEGGGASTGPNLWGVVGRMAGTKEGFPFSGAMTEYGEEWTYEQLWAYLESPGRVVPGTAMSFGGLRRETQRADVIAYLGSLSDDPRPFPEPLPEPIEEPAEEVAENTAGDAAEAASAGEEDGVAATAEPAPEVEELDSGVEDDAAEPEDAQ
ncbi:MAG: cytochrome c family protein [Maricaulaceae bacterium]|jgi:cytochrome c